MITKRCDERQNIEGKATWEGVSCPLMRSLLAVLLVTAHLVRDLGAGEPGKWMKGSWVDSAEKRIIITSSRKEKNGANP